MFATSADVQTRLGYALTAQQTEQAAHVIARVTGLIRDLLGKDQQWADSLDPVPEVFATLCEDKAIGVVVNPTNLASESEQLGAYQHSQTFQRAMDGGVFLTEAEKREVRKAAGVASFASVTMVSPYSGDDETSALDFDFPLGS